MRKRSDDTHGYNDAEVRRLFKFYFQDNPAIKLVAPIPLDRAGEVHLGDQLQQISEERASAVMQQQEAQSSKMLVPLKLQGERWALLYIVYPGKKISSPHIYYFDPLGDPVPNSLAQVFADWVLTQKRSITPICTELPETEAYQSGPWIVEVAQQVVREQYQDEPLLTITAEHIHCGPEDISDIHERIKKARRIHMGVIHERELDGEPRVYLYFWPPSSYHQRGHVALHITNLKPTKTRGNEVYISFKTSKTRPCYYFSCPQMGVFQRKKVLEESGFNKGKVSLDNTVELTQFFELDVERIYKKYKELENSRWLFLASCLPGSFENCSTVIMKVLIAGGLDRYLPFYAKPGSYQHLLMSASNIFTATCVFAAEMYALVDDTEVKTFWGSLAGLALSGMAIYGLQWLLENEKFLVGVEKRLLKTNRFDNIMGIVNPIAFAAPFMARRLIWDAWFDIDTECAKISSNGAALIAALTLSVPIVSHFINAILAAFGRVSYISMPEEVFNTICELADTNIAVHHELRQAVWQKRQALMGVILSVYTTYQAIRKSGHAHLTSLLWSIPAGSMGGYLIINFAWLRKQNRIIASYRQTSEKTVTTFIDQYDISFGRTVFILISTLLGMTGNVWLYSKETSWMPAYQSMLAFPGAGISYLLGCGISYLAEERISRLQQQLTAGFLQRLNGSEEIADRENANGSRQLEKSEGSLIFSSVTGVLLMVLFGLLEHYICDDYPNVTWIAGGEGLILGLLFGYKLSERVNIGTLCQCSFLCNPCNSGTQEVLTDGDDESYQGDWAFA